MKYITIILSLGLLVLVACAEKIVTHPESMSGGYVFNYDDEVRSCAFETAVIFVDSGYVSKVHLDGLWLYGEYLQKKEWKPDSVTLHFVAQAYMVTGQDIPSVFEGFITPEYLENNDTGTLLSEVKRVLAQIEASNHR